MPRGPLLWKCRVLGAAVLGLAVLAGCAGGRARVRLHGWPDDVDLAEVLQRMLEDPQHARSHAPHLVWTRGGVTTTVTDPVPALAPFRAGIQAAAAPPRDATPPDLRCNIERFRCTYRLGAEVTQFLFALQGPVGQRYLVLERMETSPVP